MLRWTWFLFALVGCTGHYGEAVHDGRKVETLVRWAPACTDFSDVQLDFVRDGFSYWEGMVGHRLFEEMPCVGVGEGISGVLVHREDRDYFDGTLGYESDSVPAGYWSGEIALLPAWFSGTDWLKRQVIRHEVGHLLGFDHVDDPGCIMNFEAASDEACGAEVNAIVEVYR